MSSRETSRFLFIQGIAASVHRLAAAQQPPVTLTQMLATIQDAVFQNEVQNGKVLISTSEAGGSVSFAFPEGDTPKEFIALIQEITNWCNQYPDPDNPPLTSRRIKRLRVSFAKATI